MITITDQPLDINQITQLAHSPEAGAVNVFVGTVRGNTQKKKVVRLEYEAYEPMAVSEIQKICEAAKLKWPIQKIVVSHRVGILTVGEVAVVVAVSTPHRKESFEACQFIIDSLKQTVPIWKKEIFEGGEEWISAHP
ncbi:MAG: molybdenum cofactor biosynthesis protein MoaE [Cyclobacteriaceae bacterium]|nr:molybdenum cofactor biosynthesis protein MoaE [Cyclobacteriaceae bacterium]